MRSFKLLLLTGSDNNQQLWEDFSLSLSLTGIIMDTPVKSERSPKEERTSYADRLSGRSRHLHVHLSYQENRYPLHFNLRSDVATSELGPCSVLFSIISLTKHHDFSSNGFDIACFSVITPEFCPFLYNSVPIQHNVHTNLTHFGFFLL